MKRNPWLHLKRLIPAVGVVLASCGSTSESLAPSLVQPLTSSGSQVVISQERLTFDVGISTIDAIDAGISTTQGGPLREPDSGSNSDPDRFPPRPPQVSRPPQGGIPSGGSGSGGSIVPMPPVAPLPVSPPAAPAPPPPPAIPFPEPVPEEPNLNEITPPPPELPTSVVVAGLDIAALPASEIDLLLVSGAVV
ncbi:MAG: hypothetical protein Q6L60_16020, partial [Thermostichus sp. HHBFW_bins_43]